MGFNVEFRDNEDNVLEWNLLDKEVCELWGGECNKTLTSGQPFLWWSIPPIE